MLAFMTYRDALEVMVDEVAERGETALALLAESKLASKPIKELRRQIDRSVRRDKQRETERGASVERTKDQPLETMERSALRELAYELGESKRLEDRAKAARAWVIAARFETNERAKKDCLARAALEFADAGEWEEATPRLKEITAQPKDYDSWLPDYAWYRFLDKAIVDRDVGAFRTHWKGALTMQRDEDFPFANPCQVTYLEFAVAHGLVDIAKHIVDVVSKHRSPRERKPIAALLARAQTLIGD